MNNINLMKAEQQLLGFCHGVHNRDDIIGLVKAMGLKKEEWGALKKKYQIKFLEENQFEEIEKYFNPLP